MSSDSNSPNSKYGPAVRTNHVVTPQSLSRTNTAYAGLPRGGFSREDYWTQQYGGRRDLYEALGYTEQPIYEHFEARYQRGGTASALVDKPAKDCWGERPTISDTVETEDGADDEETDFEDEVETFLRDGDPAWQPLPDSPSAEQVSAFDTDAQSGPMEVLERVDRMARLGRFGLLFVGFADDALSEGGEDALSEPVDVASLDGTDDVAYLSAYDESRVDWEVTWGQHLDENPASPRYGRPEEYVVELREDAGSVQIHHSRLVHVVEDPFARDLLSDSVLRRSLNRLDDLEKVFGGSAEAFWRSAYQGFVVSPPANGTGGQGSFTDEGEQLHDQIQAYINNYERTIFSNGEVTTLDADVASPSDHVDAYYREIAAGHDIPQSILMGNETGERATEEDRQMYHEYLARRRRQHCEQRILRPLVDRLIAFGVLPEPEGDGYDVEWPELGEPSAQERAETQSTLATALKEASGGSPSRLASDAEIRTQIFEWGAERGSEAPDDVADTEAATAADLEVDESDSAVQDQFEQSGGSPGGVAPDGGDSPAEE